MFKKTKNEFDWRISNNEDEIGMIETSLFRLESKLKSQNIRILLNSLTMLLVSVALFILVKKLSK